MTFEKIDKENWGRREYFEHYFSDVPCTYSITVKLDITGIKQKKQKLYPVLLHSLATVVNRHAEFRTAMNEAGELGTYSEMIPCYTVFHKDTETFSNLWTEYKPDLDDFCAAYEEDLLQYGTQPGITGKPDIPPNHFTVSMLPWATFEGFNLNLQKGSGYLIPIFTIGKYYQENERIIIPAAIQVHHAVCDGFHVCRFINELQELLGNDVPSSPCGH